MFYTKQQVQDLLGLPDSSLYAMIHDGRLHAYLPPNRKRGLRFYPEEVEALAQAEGNEIPTLRVNEATDGDLAQQVALSLEMVGADQTVRWSVLQQWRVRYPQLFLVVSEWRMRQILGATCLLPLQEPCMERVMTGSAPLAALRATDLTDMATGTYLLPTFFVVEHPQQHYVRLALARRLMGLIYDLLRDASPLQRILHPSTPPLAPVLRNLFGFVERPTGGYLCEPGRYPSLLSILGVISRQPAAPTFDQAPSHWLDTLALEDADVPKIVSFSLAPPRKRGRPRRFAQVATPLLGSIQQE